MPLRRVVLVAAALVAVGCAACLAPPAGPAPLRYRDLVFAGVTKTADLPYALVATRQGTTQTLLADVYRPSGDTVSKRPAIVWVHGGAFLQGVLSRTSPELVDQATTFARKGFVNVSIEYRLSPTGCGGGPQDECILAIGDALADARTAVRWLRANASTYGVDADRIAIAGTSAGAITALNVGFGGDVPSSGPYATFSSRVQGAVALSGAAIPRSTIGPGDTASLQFHGTTDPLVSYGSAKATSDAARAAGLISHLITWPGEGHVPYGAHRDQIISLTTNFLYQSLALSDAAR